MCQVLGLGVPSSCLIFNYLVRLVRLTNKKTEAMRSPRIFPKSPRQIVSQKAGIWSAGFRAHGLNHCTVPNLAGHVERTRMGVLGSREEASALGSGGGLSGSEWGMGGRWSARGWLRVASLELR